MHINLGGRSQIFLMRSQDTGPLLCRDTTSGKQQPHQHSLQWHPEPSRAWLLDHLLCSAPVDNRHIHKPTVPPIPFPFRTGFWSSAQALQRSFNPALSCGWLLPSSVFPASPWGAGLRPLLRCCYLLSPALLKLIQRSPTRNNFLIQPELHRIQS